MRRVFFSFDWDDAWRVNQVRNSWVMKGNSMAGFVDAAEIEEVKRRTDKEIRKWIDKQLKGKSVTCVLIGSKTNKSKWVKYEIEKSIEQKKGLLGVFIHKLKNNNRKTDKKGANLLKDYSKGSSFDDNSVRALVGGGAGFGLAKFLFPQLAIPAAIVGAALAILEPNDNYKIYDWIEDDGYNNLGNWIEEAAEQVGR